MVGACAGGSSQKDYFVENPFAYLKGHGYKLGHKFSRVSFNAFKNYCQCMMLAHMINQFVEKSTEIAQLLSLHNKSTITDLWKKLLAYFTEIEISLQEVRSVCQKTAPDKAGMDRKGGLLLLNTQDNKRLNQERMENENLK